MSGVDCRIKITPNYIYPKLLSRQNGMIIGIEVGCGVWIGNIAPNGRRNGALDNRYWIVNYYLLMEPEEVSGV